MMLVTLLRRIANLFLNVFDFIAEVAEKRFSWLFYFMEMKKYRILPRCALLSLIFASCREDYVVIPPEETVVDEGDPEASIVGFYLLNEGNMGTNKASLDYYDYTNGVYSVNIFPSRNPNVTKELGDVGNDLQIYGGRLYAVINCSNLVEVMTADSAKHIGMVDIPNCRYVAFYKDKAYVSSYAGPVEIGNMTLLKGGLNSIMRNQAWKIKLNGDRSRKNHIKTCADLLITKELLEIKKWDKYAIQERTGRLIQEFFTIWNLDFLSC